MPIMYVNPAKGPRPKRRVRLTTTLSRRGPARRKTPKKKGPTMAKAKRRKATTKRRKTTTKRKNPMSMAKRKRSAAAKKAAATRARNKRKRSAAAKKAAATRRRRVNPAKRRTAARRRRRRNAWAGQPRRHGWARRYGTGSKKKVAAMRKRRRRNPVAKKRYARRRRRNPAMGNGSIMSIMTKHVIPVAASLYVSRLVSGKLSGKIPGIDSIPATYRQPAIAALLLAGGHFATKKVKPLKKHRIGIMTGLGINMIDKLLKAFVPNEAKEWFGIGETDAYGPALADYVAVDDYIQIGDVEPINDDITLSDYVQIGEYGELEEDLGEIYSDLGELEQDLGMEMDLGGFSNRHLGGVSRSAMMAPIGHKQYKAPVPARSFTKPVPSFGEGFDKPNRLYTGIFGGGFGF